ncbi:MAG TPA: hypothetical protein VMZ27_03880 [Candidatus Saccharimonadales bacterium]|nr:hypothetical protein [Candidatus Saccharimonadales bacterium]
MRRIFLLSPAQTGGPRAEMVLNPNAGFELARQLHRGESVPIGELFSFLSGLYFRGKLAYARGFAKPGKKGIWIITSNKGLAPPEMRVDIEMFRAFGKVPINTDNRVYSEPLERDAFKLADSMKTNDEAVLLGSISTGKYAEILLKAFGSRLKFPVDFVGRGDMSRGGLLLRRVREGVELEYASLEGAVLRGKRPAKLAPSRIRHRDLHARFAQCCEAIEDAL